MFWHTLFQDWLLTWDLTLHFSFPISAVFLLVFFSPLPHPMTSSLPSNSSSIHCHLVHQYKPLNATEAQKKKGARKTNWSQNNIGAIIVFRDYDTSHQSPSKHSTPCEYINNKAFSEKVNVHPFIYLCY
jgi:hypothetical protein